MSVSYKTEPNALGGWLIMVKANDGENENKRSYK